MVIGFSQSQGDALNTDPSPEGGKELALSKQVRRI